MSDVNYTGNTQPDMSPIDRDYLIRTVIGEAAAEPDLGQQGVAAVIKNRLDSGKYGKSIADVVTAPNQFEPYNTPQGRARMFGVSPDNPVYQRAAQNVDSYLQSGDDPTQGATHFFAPGLQAQLGRRVPSWATPDTQTTQIGGHSFYAPDGAPNQALAYNTEQPGQQQPKPPADQPKTTGLFDDILKPSTKDAQPVKTTGLFDDVLKPSKDQQSTMGGAFSDIPHEIYQAGSSALSTIGDNLNPFSEKRRAAIMQQANAPSFMEGMKQGVSQTADVGSGILAVPQFVASPVTGASRSLIGHPMANIEHAIGTVINPQVAAKDNPTEMYETAKGDVDTAMSALAARRGSPAVLPSAPKPGPVGVTLSEGQETGNLPAIQREQSALRSPDILGNPAYERAKQFAEQQATQVDAAKEGIVKNLDPANRISIESPHDAADIISSELLSQKQAADALTQRRESLLDAAHGQYRDNLSPTKSTLASNPMEAANIVSSSVGHAAEDAQAATNSAYAVLRDLPGEFHPAAFNKVGDKIAAELNKGTNPIRVSPEVTPQAAGALRDLDEILGDVKQSRDPDTGQVLARDPVTPALVEDTRKRLNSFYGDALQSAKASNNWSDVRAMRGVMDAFDNQVADRLKKGTFIGGDAEDVIDSMQYARAKHSEYRKTFTPQGPGDAVGPAIQQIIGRFEGQAAPPEQISNMLYGKGPLPVKVAGRMLNVFGENSPEIGAVKQGLFSYITERPPGAASWTPAQVADRIDGFTNGPGSTLTRTYFNPTEIKNLQSYGKALRAHDNLINAPQDAVDKTIARITGSDGAPPASTQDTVNKLFKSTLNGERNSVDLANRLKTQFGETSPQYVAFKQGLFRHAIEPGEGLSDWGPKKIADNLNKLLNVTGKQGATVIYSPQDRALIQSYADLMRKIDVPQAGANWSNTATFMARNLNRMSGLVGMAVGATVGHAVGLPWGAAEAGGYAASKALGSISNTMNARQIARQMPLVTTAIQNYQKALNAAQRANSPPSNAAISFATTNLVRSLKPLGIDLSRMQSPSIAPTSEQDQGNNPWLPSQQKRGGKVSGKQRAAHGGYRD